MGRISGSIKTVLVQIVPKTVTLALVKRPAKNVLVAFSLIMESARSATMSVKLAPRLGPAVFANPASLGNASIVSSISTGEAQHVYLVRLVALNARSRRA